jgi:hypothetical protein
MPFKSKRQQRWMFVNEPEMAKEWASKTDFKKLPEKTKKKNRKKKAEVNYDEIIILAEYFYSINTKI